MINSWELISKRWGLMKLLKKNDLKLGNKAKNLTM